MFRFSPWFFVGVFVLFISLTTGCNFFGLNGSEDTLSLGSTTKGPANVNFKIVLPDQPKGNQPLPAILANGLTARVTFRLIVVTPGASGANTTILTKTVDVVDGKVTATFNGVPTQTTVGEILIENGTLGGKTDFHGASDLMSGDNTMEISPKGCGLRSDIIANVVLAIANLPDAIRGAPAYLVAAIENAASTELMQGGSSAYNDALNSFLVRGITPGTFGRLTRSVDGTSISADGVASPWTKTSSQIWQGTPFQSEGFIVDKILRQGFGGFAYVSWTNPANTKYAVTRIDSSNGALLKRIVSEGPGRMTMVLPDDSILVGGSLDSLPFLFRWDGSTETILNTGSIAGFLGKWAHSFTELTKNASLVPFPMVEYLELPVETGGQITCVARDPQNGQARVFRVNPDTGAATAVGASQSLALWANPGDGNVSLGWDPLPGTQTYTLYWHTADTVSETVNSGILTNVRSPFVHPARTNGTAYYYMLQAVSDTNVKQLSKVVGATPRLDPRTGAGWAMATGTAAFSTRTLAAGASFNSKLWIAGGVTSPTAYLNDVWSSLDGLVWTPAAPSAAFPARAGHSLLALGTNLFVIGGKGTSDVLYNDVWSSADGGTWVSKTAAAGFTKRTGHAGIVFNNQLWVMAGYDGTAKNDVWSSSDGITWNKILDAASFSARVSPAVTVFNGKMWLIGGTSDLTSAPMNDIWSSPDGASWTKVLDLTDIRNRANACLTSLGGRLWLLGGRSGSEYPTNALVSSTGSSWLTSDSLAGFPGRSGAVNIAQGDRIWIIGGERDGKTLSDVWYSQGIASGANIPPSVTIVNPASGSVVVSPLSILADARDIDGNITRVDFFAGPNKIGEAVATQPPFLCTWNSTASGSILLTARATDNLGGVKTSDPVLVTISLASGPRVIQSTLAGGDWFSPNTWVASSVPSATDSVVINGPVSLTRLGTACVNLDIAPTGRLSVNAWSSTQAVVFMGSLNNYGTFHGAWDTNVTIYGNFNNQGTVSRAGSNIWFFPAIGGNFTQNGIYDANWTFFIGTATQHISVGPGKIMAGTFLDCTPEAGFIADTDLNFGTIYFRDNDVVGSHTLDMNGHKMTFQGSADFYDFKIINCTQLYAGVDMTLGATKGNWYFHNPNYPLHIGGQSIWMKAGITVAGDLFIDAGAKILPIYNSGHGNLTVTGTLTNNGTIATFYESNSGRSINMLIGKALVQNGVYQPNETYFNGATAETIAIASGTSLAGNYYDLTPTTSLVAATDLSLNGAKFLNPTSPTASSTLDMNGKKLIVQGENQFADYIIRNCPEVNAVQNANFMHYNGRPHFVNPSFPLHFSGKDIGLTSGTTVDGDLILDAGARIVTIWNTGTGNLTITGNFTNNGWVQTPYISNSGSLINFLITGDLVQNATYTPNETYFIGANQQNISVATGCYLKGNYWDNTPTSPLVAKSNLPLVDAYFLTPTPIVASPTLDMAGYKLIMSGTCRFAEHIIKNCPEVYAALDCAFDPLNGKPHFVNTAYPLHFNGATTGIPAGTTVDGDLIIDAGAKIGCIYNTGHGSLTITGNFTNNGTVDTAYVSNSGVSVNLSITGNLIQNGIYTPNETYMIGTTQQSLSCGTNARIQRNLWDTTPSSPLQAQTTLYFKDCYLQFGSTTASGTLDMNGKGINIESQLQVASTAITNLASLSASGTATIDAKADSGKRFTCVPAVGGMTMNGTYVLTGFSGTGGYVDFNFYGPVTVGAGSVITPDGSATSVRFNTVPAGNLVNNGNFYSVGGANGYHLDMIVNGVMAPDRP